LNLLMFSGDSSVARGARGPFYQMLRHFSAYWTRIDILCRGGGDAAPTVVHGNVYVHPSPWPALFQPLYLLRRGAALCAEQPYALIASHDYGLFLNGIGAALLSRRTALPWVSEIHHVEGYPRAVTGRERLYRALALRYIPWMARRAAAIRTVNAIEVPGLLRQLGVPEHKILVLPSLYLDFDVFHPYPDEPIRYDLLFVGRLVANKGLFTMLDALALLRKDYPAIRLGIRGDGPLRAALERRSTALRLEAHIDWIPRFEEPGDLARLYAAARMLVCASTVEGGPRVTAEAMACGVPVISTPVGIMPELIQDGVNGLLFHWDAAELAAQAGRLLANEALRMRLAEAGRASVQGFRAEEVIARYAQGYHNLIARLHGADGYLPG